MKRRINAVLVTAGLTVAGIFGGQATANAAVTQNDPPYIPITCLPTNAWGGTCWYIEGTQFCQWSWDGIDETRFCYTPDLWPNVPA